MFQDQLYLNEVEFYYLVQLTRQKIKPLSRWEKPLDDAARRWLQRQGLFVDVISRQTRDNGEVHETVFSISSRYVDAYHRKFNHTVLSKNQQAQTLEGFFFGYPSCCVRQFTLRPYLPNGLPKAEQSLLFHWACPDCRVTPELIPCYRSVHEQVSEWFRQEIPANPLNRKPLNRPCRRKFQAALTAFFLSTGLLSGQSPADTTHYIPLPNDDNNNGLSYAEEIYLGNYQPGLPDACQISAIFFKAIIDTLPATVQTDRSYKLEYYMRGVVQCPKCGELINMGYITLVNPRRNLEIDIPFLGLHFMENGYFSFGADPGYQRVDIDILKKILYPYHAEHMLPVSGDSDGDGLTDAEEDSLGLPALTGDDDRDGVPDGAQIAEELVRLFPKLKDKIDHLHSYVSYYPVFGIENCQVCGSLHNMGYIEINNPENQHIYQIPYISLHALAHGSFAYNGTVHQHQRTDAIALYRSMKTHLLYIENDSDNDGLSDAEEAEFGFDSNNPDSDGDGVGDGTQLASYYVDFIKYLPTEPRTEGPYVEYLDMDGVERCSVCGGMIPMGMMKIYNPLINCPEPLEITYYAFHFMEHGSFAYEYGNATLQYSKGRIAPKQLENYLGYPTGIGDANDQDIPRDITLNQNYPNPFNPATTISYALSRKAKIVLTVYDISGRHIRTLVNTEQSAGVKSVIWDGRDDHHRAVSSGMYFYQLQAGKQRLSKKMLLLR